MNPVVVSCIKTENAIHEGNTNMAKMICFFFFLPFPFRLFHLMKNFVCSVTHNEQYVLLLTTHPKANVCATNSHTMSRWYT